MRDFRVSISFLSKPSRKLDIAEQNNALAIQKALDSLEPKELIDVIEVKITHIGQ
jgi:hypothetical protein